MGSWIKARLQGLADQRRRLGYRRLHALLRSKDWTMNRKKTHRIYSEERPAERRCEPAAGPRSRTPIPRPAGPNSRWSLDFVHDQLAWGRRFRVLTIIDDLTKECLAAARHLVSGKRVVDSHSKCDTGYVRSRHGNKIQPPQP
jgi:putative transposase